MITENDLRKLEADYCCWGDAVHSTELPKIFESCEGIWKFESRREPRNSWSPTRRCAEAKSNIARWWMHRRK